MLCSFFMVSICRLFPRAAKPFLLRERAKLLPPDFNLEPDFVSSYNPWEQRLCFCPYGDFYACIRSGKGSVNTGTIESITASSIKLASGKELHPDIIVTATGLKLCTAGGIPITIDGEPSMSVVYPWKKEASAASSPVVALSVRRFSVLKYTSGSQSGFGCPNAISVMA
ncbi:flavoprotein [Penicillium desertorum]|uniref:Flavoprotein n=1 Tax=Penicillium desertorum TaxID=1303715 RepID=A0A9W9WPY1_9EURO|nr:flavoprotein [Penicillium desertorum]